MSDHLLSLNLQGVLLHRTETLMMLKSQRMAAVACGTCRLQGEERVIALFKMLFQQGTVSVSYTHLDVYKRQA